MNASIKAAAVAESSRANLFQLRAALFHSTPVLERARRKQWQRRLTHSRTPRNHQWKRHVLRNFNSISEEFFERLIPTLERDDQGFGGPTWFRRQEGPSGSRRHGDPNCRFKARGRRGFEFCDDDDDFNAESIFGSAFGGERISFWSFVNEDNSRWRRSSAYSNNAHRGGSWHWRVNRDDDDDCSESSSDTDCSELTSASDRLALGLSAYGPLKLDDVKHAYRTCALKYHPDRHQGPSKNAAEEKFKLCTAAYQSLCDKLAVN
ncbi:hypothetical protein V2J09_012294 [Rumex salicifolius]